MVLVSGAGLQPARPAWILFDAVGTLIYPDPPVAEVYHDAGRRYGSRLTELEIERRFRAALAEAFAACELTSEPFDRLRWQQIVAAVFEDVPAADGLLFEQLWQHFSRPTSWRLFDDVPQTLTELASRGYHLGIASNFDARLRQIVAGHAPLVLCERLLLSSELGYVKPDPRFFAAAAKVLMAAPMEILLVGDDEAADVAGAHAAGWQAALVCRTSQPDNPAAFRDIAQLLQRLA